MYWYFGSNAISQQPLLDELINRLVNTEDPDEVKVLYRQWAETYDRDLDGFGYVAPQIGAKLLRQCITDKHALIHDAGCGTGWVGRILCDFGYHRIDGSDFSADMLDLAGERGDYQSLVQADFTQSIEFPDHYYDGIISIGVYTKRFKGIFLSEMLRTLKPGGWMVFSCRPLYFEEVAESVKELHLQQSIASSSVILDDYMVGQQASAFYLSLQKPVS